LVIDLASRRVEIVGISRCPDGFWMEQVARNLLDAGDGFLLGKRYLILDRDPLYTREFRAAIKGGGVEVLRLPPSSPNLTTSPVGETGADRVHRRNIYAPQVSLDSTDRRRGASVGTGRRRDRSLLDL
jgi:hypothetical protein